MYTVYQSVHIRTVSLGLANTLEPSNVCRKGHSVTLSTQCCINDTLRPARSHDQTAPYNTLVQVLLAWQAVAKRYGAQMRHT